ncbi:hypothetical protein [uncultured Stenotrophomonas sp.]|uniref:hypothetical protein n=1 Tax=uncultured Stenotrophomonas sp. TaxID=165438 RepID=UPI0025E8F2AB|nr:hypothetical protein [uncultured Stenotrophomonas sp.]
MQLILHRAESRDTLNYHELQWLQGLDATLHRHLATLRAQPRGSLEGTTLATAMDELLQCLATVPGDDVQRRGGLRLLLVFAAAHRNGQAVAWQTR